MKNNIMQEIEQFITDRNWRQNHNAKDLAVAISIESGELLEDFLWLSAEEGLARNMENIKEELADVLIYAYQLASLLDLDVEEIMREKIAKNALKYPIEK
ncbi:NTP pyrophosphatase, house-cleaning of non-canonical NTPs [Pilibacter termitis]|uniref:NTP pyrophosphatase, house-cleaning of non-canonical NTPs n=1 Tax=Pilibacter termitis TaxID=263852 RepID=A0A1T4M7Q3_9ENTE|nr:nucleotide pyrophosphohydrolase [Pilibacter termitis]SJZ63039.1 NTP pyrophosphatase, house-cleaning of non-canonical NTPs [Pilibacter termitis]